MRQMYGRDTPGERPAAWMPWALPDQDTDRGARPSGPGRYRAPSMADTSLEADDRRLLNAWFERLRDWKNDESIRSRSRRLKIDDPVYTIQIDSDLLIAFKIVEDRLRVLSIFRKEAALPLRSNGRAVELMKVFPHDPFRPRHADIEVGNFERKCYCAIELEDAIAQHLHQARTQGDVRMGTPFRARFRSARRLVLLVRRSQKFVGVHQALWRRTHPVLRNVVDRPFGLRGRTRPNAAEMAV